MHEEQPPRASENAFTAFCEQHWPTILARLKRSGVPEADVQDVAQRVLLKIHRYFDKMPADGVEAWLSVICGQQVATYYRPPYRRLERPELADCPVPDKNCSFERLESVELVGRVLGAMDARLADILVSHLVDDETLPDIAKKLGISRTTAQRRLDEAKKVFQRKVTEAQNPSTADQRPKLCILPFGFSTLLHHDNPVAAELVPPSSRSFLGDVKPTRAPKMMRLAKNPLVWWGLLAPLGGFALGTITKSEEKMPLMRDIEPVVMAIVLDNEQLGQTRGGALPGKTVTPA